MASQERTNAGGRLDAALVEQERLTDRFEAAIGTSAEFAAYVRLQGAGEEVKARQAWVDWVEDESYRGVNAGPFELLSESHELAGITEREGGGS
jgi:hypothetical protein